MKKLKEILKESFDKPYPIRWREEKGRMGGQVVTGIFKTDEGTIYEIKFVIWEQDGEIMGNVEFRQPKAQSQGKHPSGILGTGDEFRVFATVLDGIEYITGRADFDSLTFDADKELPTRVKLYNRLVKKLANKIGYTAKIDDTSDEDAVIYTLSKSTKDTLTEVFDKPLPWEWTKWNIDPTNSDLDHAQAKVNSGDIQLEITLEQETRGDFQGYELTFSRIDEDGFKKYNKTGQGNASQIFATVIDVVKDFVERHKEKFPSNPLRSISFSAEKDDIRVKNDIFSREYKTGSRAKLYTRMINTLAPKIGATAKILDARDTVYFGLRFPRAVKEDESAKLNEAFEKPYKWKWDEVYADEEYGFESATAITVPSEKTQIKVVFNYKWEDEVEVGFTRITSDGSERHDMVGEGDAFRIFATVIDVIKDFVNKDYPEWIGKPLKKLSFSAQKPSKDNLDHLKLSQSRVKLYDRMVKRLASSMGAKVNIEDTPSQSDYQMKFK